MRIPEGDSVIAISCYECEEYIDPDFKWGNFTVEEQAKVITAARSNNELSPHKMWKEFPGMLPIRDSLIQYVFKPAQTDKSKARSK